MSKGRFARGQRSQRLEPRQGVAVGWQHQVGDTTAERKSAGGKGGKAAARSK